MKPTQLITGIILIAAGIAIIVTSLFTTLFLIIYAVIALGVGIAILLNKKEDKIEQINEPSRKTRRK